MSVIEMSVAKRAGAAAAAIAGVLFGLWGCGGALEQVDPRGQQVVYWHKHTGNSEQPLLDLIGEFNRTNGYAIQVRGEYAGTYEQIYDRMGTVMRTGGVPQLVSAYHNQAADYQRAGAVIDLTPYLDSPRWGLSAEDRADYVQIFLQQDRVGEIQIALRPQFSMEVLYYNVDWLTEMDFSSPPRNWGEFGEMCRSAWRQPFSRSQDPGASLGLLLAADASRLASMVFSRGGRLINRWQRSYTLNTPQMRESLELLRDLRQDGAMDVTRDMDLSRRAFSSGRAPFLLCSSSRLRGIDDAVDQGLGFAWNVAALPHEGTPIHNIYGGSVAVCQSTPEQQLASWLFLKWFTQPRQQSRWVQGTNYFPVRRSAAVELSDFYRTAFGLLREGRSEPSVGGYELVRRQMVSAMMEILDGADMGQVLQDLEERANETLRR